jgi:hypothetical protein
MEERMYSSTILDLETMIEVSGQLHAPAAFIHGERSHSNHSIESWAVPRADLAVVE